jgi:hypothetical protein
MYSLYIIHAGTQIKGLSIRNYFQKHSSVHTPIDQLKLQPNKKKNFISQQFYTSLINYMQVYDKQLYMYIIR